MKIENNQLKKSRKGNSEFARAIQTIISLKEQNYTNIHIWEKLTNEKLISFCYQVFCRKIKKIERFGQKINIVVAPSIASATNISPALNSNHSQSHITKKLDLDVGDSIKEFQ